MSRPLIPNPQRKSEADEFHRAVFKAHGSCCYFCGKKGATDAMHLIPRARLGKRQRYACPVENGRPGCRACHSAQERNELRFRLVDVRRAVRALNKISKVSLAEPAA